MRSYPGTVAETVSLIGPDSPLVFTHRRMKLAVLLPCAPSKSTLYGVRVSRATKWQSPKSEGGGPSTFMKICTPSTPAGLACSNPAITGSSCHNPPMEQAEQPEPKRGRRKWPWLLAVAALVGIGWAGAAWDASQDEFAFLNDLHPRRGRMPEIPGMLGNAKDCVVLSFPKETSPKVAGVLKSELTRRGWTVTTIDKEGSLMFTKGDPGKGDDRTLICSSIAKESFSSLDVSAGECGISYRQVPTPLEEAISRIKGWLHLSP
jgi:hypothetical protein